MHYFGSEIGGGGGGVFALNCTEFVAVNANGGVQCTSCTQFRGQTVELSAKRMMQGRWRFIQVNNNTFLSVLVARMVDNHLAPCTFSTTERIQR